MKNNTREIKFRVWDFTGEKWMDVFSVDLTDECYLNNPECGIQQFVGILDKNSKEIYEGDILTGHMGYSPDVKLTGVVEFSTETLGYGLRFNPNPDTKDSLTEDLFLVHNLEVVGNIYENGDIIPDISLGEQ